MPNNSVDAATLLAELGQFTGDLERWQHPLDRKLIYTPGVRHLAERAGADSEEKPFIRQATEYTDFPLTEIDLYCAFNGEHWTLMLRASIEGFIPLLLSTILDVLLNSEASSDARATDLSPAMTPISDSPDSYDEPNDRR